MPISTEFFHALVILNLLFVSGAWSLARPSRRSSLVLVAVAVMWVLWNGPVEGAVLVRFTLHHGITESDLLSALALVIAAAGVWRSRKSSRRRR